MASKHIPAQGSVAGVNEWLFLTKLEKESEREETVSFVIWETIGYEVKILHSLSLGWLEFSDVLWRKGVSAGRRWHPDLWVWLTGLEVYSQTAGLSRICIHRKKNACIDYSSFLNLKVFISISENRTERTSEWNVETHLKLISVYGFQMNLGFMLCHRCQRWYVVKYEELMFQIKWT